MPAPPPPGAPSRSGSGTAAPPTPTNVLADRMVAQHDSQTVHYEGHVRAWQGTDVIESSSLDVFQKERRLSSGSKVVTSYLRPASHSAKSKVPSSAPGAMEPVTISADYLEYLDQGRRAHYHGNVKMVSEDTTLQSDRLDVYLLRGESAEGSQIDHAVADGHVRVTQPGRRGLSQHAEYFAGPGEIVMTGGTPSLFDVQKGYTAGQRLTVYTQNDRLLVDGGEKSPSLTEHRVVR
jgi:lipopolysaccharide export system protein LptA